MAYTLLNTSFQAVDVVEDYDTLIWTDRYASAGDFELHVAASRANISKYKEDYYLVSDEDYRVMILDTIEIVDDAESGSKLKVTGVSLEYILDRRILWGYYTLSGSLQTAVKRLLNEAAISPTDSTRKISNLSMIDSTDPLITSLQIDTQYLGTNLYTAISELCAAYDIGFQILMPTPGVFQFKLYAGVDRSYSQGVRQVVMFSPDFDNMGGSTYLRSVRGRKTVTLVGGEGQDANKRFAQIAIKSGTASGLNRREIYTDASSITSTVDGATTPAATYLKQLQQKGLENLTDNGVVTTFDGSIEIVDSAKYLTHFWMGDIIQMENSYGAGASSRVVEFIRAYTPTGMKAYPTLAAT